jgi:hypothetical protein
LKGLAVASVGHSPALGKIAPQLARGSLGDRIGNRQLLGIVRDLM